MNWKLANAIADMQKRQRDVAELDAKYTKELADANAENDVSCGMFLAGARKKIPCQAETTTSGMGVMMPPSNSLQLLDETFSISGTDGQKH